MPQTISKEYKKPLKAPYSYTVVQEKYQCSFQQFNQARTINTKFYTDQYIIIILYLFTDNNISEKSLLYKSKMLNSERSLIRPFVVTV